MTPQPAYHLLTLPLAEVSGINDKGQVIGIRYPKSPYEDNTDGYSKAYLSYVWEKGKLRSLGASDTHPRVLAVAINNTGDIVGAEEGTTNSEFPSTLGDAYFWRHSRKIRLPSLVLDAAEADATFARSINNRGVIVGSSGNAHIMGPIDTDNWEHAVVWTNGKLTDLGWGEAKAINDQEEIVGNSTTFLMGSGQYQNNAALWKHGQKTVIGDGTANAINRRGQIVGTFDNGHAFLYDHGQTTDLGKCNGLAINDGGQILLDGDWDDSYHSVYLWQNHRRYDINHLVHEFTRWSGLSVVGINNKGCIVGYGTFQNQERAFLLVPKASETPTGHS